MELEVQAVSGIESCFVSLPLSFIQTLQSTSGGALLPPILALELRSRAGDLWHVAWSGSASGSSAIEVSQQMADCIGLEDQTTVLVKLVPTVSKAIVVSIEPCSENDWEILELNSDLAEDAILKQVGIVYEGMKFPLWLHGHIVVKFVVVSVSPRKSVVQLVPGTEVAVAPKLRKKTKSSEDALSAANKQLQSKALLRIQALSETVVHGINFRGLELGVVLTSAIFVHPDTARNLSLDNLQLVIMLTKLRPDEKMQKQKNNSPASSNTAEIYSSTSLLKKEDCRHAFVRLLFSDAVAKGHVMLPHSLRLLLRARLHSWVYLKDFNMVPKKEIPKLTLHPCRFKMDEKIILSEHIKPVSFGSFDNPKNQYDLKSDLSHSPDTRERLLQEEILSFFSGTSRNQGSQEARITSKMEDLIHAWVIGQINSTSLADMNISSVVLASETLLHFEVFRSQKEEHVKSNCFLEKGVGTGKSPIELFFLLSASFEGSSFGYPYGSFELPIRFKESANGDIKELCLELGELELGAEIFLDPSFDRKLERNYMTSIFSLSWLEVASSDAINRIQVLLSPYSGRLLHMHHLPFPGHVVIYGPPGSGKTSLTMAVAKYFEEHKEILAHIVFVNCSKLALEKSQSIRQTLSAYISEALTHSPSLVILDDLDHIISNSESESSQSSNSAIQLAEFLIDVIDEYEEKRHISCGFGSVAFVATVRALTSLPKKLTSSGRFDFHIQLPYPAISEREDILKHEIYKRSLQCSAEILADVASKCDGYDAYDLEILVDRAIHASIGRHLSSQTTTKKNEIPSLVREDFLLALQDFIPVAMRGLTKGTSQGVRSGWDDVGGLAEIRKTIQEMIEMPSKYPAIFSEAPLRLRSNILLYGPPGCGKTHIVGAAASACSLRFISIKGPELLNKYIGASEQAVRDLFSKAAAAAPCLLFFDEFDSIAPKRGHDNTGVTDRVVNQLLTELDGVEALTGVFVFAATSRPDLLDAALLRPGRLDRLLFCDFPSWHERLAILKVLSRKLPLAEDVNLETVASMTDGFSGADLQALLSDAQLASVHELLDSDISNNGGKPPIISGTLLISVASRARPSVSESEKRRLNSIYSQFLDAKKSMNTQARDVKGKRATLA